MDLTTNHIAEHRTLVNAAKRVTGTAAKMGAAWAGSFAREKGLEIANPFNSALDAELHDAWMNGLSNGIHAAIPTAQIISLDSWRPRPGITHAARCAVAD